MRSSGSGRARVANPMERAADALRPRISSDRALLMVLAGAGIADGQSLFLTIALMAHQASPPTTPTNTDSGSTASPVDTPISAIEFPTPAAPTPAPASACSAAP